jgi:iron-sulfur cluster repair protein YtfE (RIC family)
MEIEDKKICDVIAGSPEAEDILENAGVDYWFRWKRMLRPACQAAHVDPDEVAARLVSCPPRPGGESQPATLAALLRDSDQQWRQRIAPAITAVVTAAARLTGGRAAGATRLLGELQRQLEQHMATSRSLLPAADAIERGQAGILDCETLRTFRLEHLEFARIARDLRAEADRLAADADAAELVAAMRTVIREIHRHNKVGYNFILPRLVAAAAARPLAAGEPW